jgi:glycogen synthase
MKVLMFGWEFPPHISGGLGTACAGLTQALEKAEIEVLFTVPKLHGGERADGMTFISASNIPIIQERIIGTHHDVSHDAGVPYNRGAAHGNILTTVRGRQTRTEVPSRLIPYTDPTGTHSWGLENWNYSFGNATDRNVGTHGLSKSHTPDQLENQFGSPMRKPYNFSGTYGSNLLEEVARYAEAGAEISKQNTFDVIHSHDWMTYPAGIAAKRVSGRPLVVHVHATEIDRSGAHGVNPEVFAIEKEGMHAADRVVTVSNWTRDIAVKYYHVNEKKIVVVHNGINGKRSKVSSSPPPPVSAPIVTFLGRITYQKGPAYFVEAARKVHEKLPEAHFVIAGSGDQLPNMIERIAQLRLSEKFHFTGFLREEDVDRIWAMSNVYVMPSVSEPFGIAPLEAIQAGVPVIISKQAGVSEIMPHAIKVDFWNTDALAEAICNVLRFDSLANTLRKNGAEQIRNITWNEAARKLTTLYYELTTNHDQRKKSRSLLSGTSAQPITNPSVL